MGEKLILSSKQPPVEYFELCVADQTMLASKDIIYGQSFKLIDLKPSHLSGH